MGCFLNGGLHAPSTYQYMCPFRLMKMFDLSLKDVNFLQHNYILSHGKLLLSLAQCSVQVKAVMCLFKKIFSVIRKSAY